MTHITAYPISSPVPHVDIVIPPTMEIGVLRGQSLLTSGSGSILCQVSPDELTFWAANYQNSQSGDPTTSGVLLTGVAAAGGNNQAFGARLNYAITPGGPDDYPGMDGTGACGWLDNAPIQTRNWYARGEVRIHTFRIFAPGNFTAGSFWLVWA